MLYIQNVCLFIFRKKVIYRLFGKWNDFLKCASEEDYQLNMQQKHVNESMSSHDRNARKLFSKLNSFKMPLFLGASIEDVSARYIFRIN